METLLPSTEMRNERALNYRLAIYFASESARRLLNGVTIYGGFMTNEELEIRDRIMSDLATLMIKVNANPTGEERLNNDN
jgi:hypothetical protein